MAQKNDDNQAPRFIPGLELNEAFYEEIVRPLMDEHFPGLKYSAGLVGHGSDVLGFDSPRSVDHNWGPRLHIFLEEADYVAHKHQISEMLATHLPYAYKGFSTNFVEGDTYRKDIPKVKKKGKIRHLFEFWTVQSFFMHYLGFDIKRRPSYQDWLLFPQQALLEVTAGKLFRDDLNVENIRRVFAYFPDDIWRYMMSVQWGKLRDEVQFQARAGEVGDELGSKITTSRTIQKIMFLCFLIERKYVPYNKWFGTAFKKWLSCAPTLHPLLLDIVHEHDSVTRQRKLAKVYQILGGMHNKLGITKKISTKIVDFFGRGYPFVDLWEYEKVINESIENEKLRTMKFALGNIDQFIDHARINHINYIYTELRDIIK